jgi:hypothetical protein
MYVVAYEAEVQQVAVFAMSGPPACVVMAILNALTDELSEVFWGEAIPPCPGHAHPMRPVEEPVGQVWWRCPKDGRAVDQVWPTTHA